MVDQIRMDTVYQPFQEIVYMNLRYMTRGWDIMTQGGLIGTSKGCVIDEERIYCIFSIVHSVGSIFYHIGKERTSKRCVSKIISAYKLEMK